MRHKNKKQPKTTISEWIKTASGKLQKSSIPTSKLDSEIILAKALKVKKTYLHAHPEKELTKKQLFHANNWLNKRLSHVPIAYILKEKEFFGRRFKLSDDVLIPRPESEEIIDLYKKIIQPNDYVIDIGTGSGILAISVFLEHRNQYPNSQLQVVASDISEKALEIAKLNTELLNADITFVKSNLLEEISPEIKNKINVVIANLPYVDKSWVNDKLLSGLNFEPSEALYAENGGLELIIKLISQLDQLPNLQNLILEADPVQHEQIITIAKSKNMHLKTKMSYCLLLSKNNS